jgi:hypothetical protein
MILARAFKPDYLTSIHNGLIVIWLIVWGFTLSLFV